jgi:hypothetical protein
MMALGRRMLESNEMTIAANIIVSFLIIRPTQFLYRLRPKLPLAPAVEGWRPFKMLMKLKHLQDKGWFIVFGIQTVYIKAGRQRITL